MNKMQEDQQSSLAKSELSSQNFLSSLRQLQSNINKDITKMTNLKQVYYETQQKKFLHTFINIMDRMSNELQRANEMYQSIDKQIEENQQCKYLSKELEFFQNQCIDLRKTLRSKQDRLLDEKNKEKMLKSQQDYLERMLYQSSYKQMKYKAKMEVASRRKNDSIVDIFKSNRTTETRSKSMKIRNKSTQMNENLYEQIYKNRPKSLRRATSIRPQRQAATMYLQTKKSTNLFSSFKQG